MLIGLGIVGALSYPTDLDARFFGKKPIPEYKTLETKLDTTKFDSVEDKFTEIVNSDWAKKLDYSLGGKKPRLGSLDCSGFVYHVLDKSFEDENFKIKKALDKRGINNTAVVHFVDIYRKNGIVSNNMASDFGEYVGDVIFFRNPELDVSRHIGFAVKDEEDLDIIHCTRRPGVDGYKNEDFDVNYWNKRGYNLQYGRLPKDVRERLDSSN